MNFAVRSFRQLERLVRQQTRLLSLLLISNVCERLHITALLTTISYNWKPSLLLEFYSESSAKWFKVWSAPGTTMQDFLDTNHCYFKIVMISLNDSLDSVRYFSKNFQFRFRNFASLANNYIPSWAGNVDQWNVDYVYLNIHRSNSDTIFHDITFAEKAPSLLKNYHLSFLIYPSEIKVGKLQGQSLIPIPSRRLC